MAAPDHADARTTPDSEIAVVRTRLGSLEQNFLGFERDVTARFSELAIEIRALGTKFDERQRIPWPALTVALSAIGMIGALAYMPLLSAQNKTDQVVGKIAESYTTTKETDSVAKAADERFKRIEGELEERRRLIPSAVFKADLDKALAQSSEIRMAERNTTLQRLTAIEAEDAKLRDNIVPRGEHEEHWHSQEARNLELQRQINELKQFQTDLVPPREFLHTLDERLRNLEQKR